MPCSSSALISVASVKRGGGSVKCWVGVTSRTGVDVALAQRGSVRSASSAVSSWPSV